jgi:glyoxylase-like metal-dependent hydrolase (beta-lactamase superfamily II)
MNRLKLLLIPALVVPAMVVGAATAQDARGVLQAAAKAMGSDAVQSVQYTASKGWLGSPGQSYAPNGDWPRGDLASYTATIDYGSKSAKEEYVRVQGNNSKQGGGGIPIQGQQRVTNFVSGNYAWNLNQKGEPNPQPQNAEIRQLMIWASPHGFIKAAQQANDLKMTDRTFIGQGKNLKVLAFTTMDKYRMTGEINDQNLLERVVTWIPDRVMGDMQVEIRYSDYRDVGNGVRFPHRIHAHQGDHPLLPGGNGRNWMDLTISSVQVNVPASAVAVPDAVRNAPAPQERVVSTQLAPGVWLMGGGSHNSVAIEFRDFIAVVEGPLDDSRSIPVIAEVKRVIPNKPIRYLINTHHHFDHLGGTRAYVAEGAIVVTHEGNENFYEDVVFAPQVRTLMPDRLSQFPWATTGPGPAPIEAFGERHAISDGQRTIQIFHVQGLNHNQNMAIVYLPQERIVINADLWSPPAQGATPNVGQSQVSLYNNIRRLGLNVETHVPIHGNPGPHAQFEQIVGPVAAQQAQAGGGAAGGGG